MDPERGFGSKMSHHHSSSTSTNSHHTSTNGTIQHQHNITATTVNNVHSNSTSATSIDSTQQSRARSYSHSHHSASHGHHTSFALPSSGLTPIGAPSAGFGLETGTRAGLGSKGGLFGSNFLSALKINIHHHSHHLDHFSRSITARVRRFFRSNGVFHNATGTIRRVRFGVLLPLAALVLWLIIIINSFLFRLMFGARDGRGNPNEPMQPPTWIDRGDISDLDLRPTEGTNMTTAILLNWSRLDSLKEIVDHLCPHIMFKEIMIWNNKVDIHLEEKMFNCPKVRVFNSPNNMFFVARYMACAMASSPYCYFQDDDWKIFYLRSMYANFLRFPQFLHTDTNSDVWSLTNWRWCFFEDEVNMHACFSWLGTGAMATRESVVKFLKQSSITEMDPLEFAYGDMYFSTFLNQVPYQLENYLKELVDPAQDVVAFSKGSEGKTRNKLYMHKAAQKVWEALKRKDPNFEREELHPTYLERDVRSPCADDRCLVLSNKNPFPDVRMFKYRPYIDIEENEKIHTQYEDPTPYVRHPFSHAVDGMDDTAYKSTRSIVQGDYIGIDMLLPVDRKIEYRLLYQMGDQWIKHAKLEVAGGDAVYRDIPFTYNCKEVRNPDYRGKVSLDVERAFLNQPLDHRVFDASELEKHGYGQDIDGGDSRNKKPILSYYEDYGWRTQCKFVVHEAKGFRFMRLVSGRDERYPFVIYDLGWKVI
ncbi:hypothetical protein BCR41DRAFT_422220 [Lobosporangium transversale]|uniref:Uncharacterized protein n=1 Tax=Lobosporangium transversale TaxID=64571 RepID=A0A1Y2GM11_9FUNG|nr:hypothetical protein BCR41DRAFT_422220 [Lobosporangium transversale]ORZ15420.1 hypothetical protein BCR41DRAFT_422220 [Lobosporangium transversale]|eukprot:XP_021881168.1 hypothetical protein BCR41DRAFT_422220 [Lobosporangium transversale]